MRRREVLRCAGLAVAPTAPSWRKRGARNPVWKTAIGLNGFESAIRKYKQSHALPEILAFAARLGFDGVELVAKWPEPYPAATDRKRIEALRSLYDGFGLRIFSIQLSASGAFDPTATVRQQWLEEIADRVALARALGCAHVGLWPGGGLRGQPFEEALFHLIESLRRVGDLAARHGLLAAFEIEPPFVFNTEEHLTRILRGIDHPAVKTIYDPSHFDLMSGSTGRPHEMLARVGVGNIGYVHLTDTDGTLRDGGTSKHLPAGDGHVDVPASLAMLREGGYRGWIMVDEYEVEDPYDACVKAKRAMDLAARG